MFGYQVATGATRSVGLAAGVGDDLPAQCKNWLQRVGCDLGGLMLRPRQTPRAWQILEDDGRRTEVWRTEFGPEVIAMLRPHFDELPAVYQQPRSCHLAVHPLDPPMTLLHNLRKATSSRGGLLSVEPYTFARTPPSPQQLTELVTAGDIFTPNRREAASLVGRAPPLEMADRLIEAGAKIVAIRCGENGSVVKDSTTGEAWQVPAVRDIEVVDVTGCGNTYCGGFMGGMDQGLGILDSALWGAVAASFMAEAQGVPTATPVELRAEALRRVEALRPKAVQLSAPVARRQGLQVGACMLRRPRAGANVRLGGRALARLR